MERCNFYRSGGFDSHSCGRILGQFVVFLVVLLYASAGFSTVTGGDYELGEVSVTVADLLERFGYRGEPIPYAYDEEAIEQQVYTAGRAVEVTMFKNERENVQLLLSSTNAGLSVSQISVSAPSEKLNGKTANQSPVLSAFIVGDLEGIDYDGSQIGPFPDVMFPVDERDFIDSNGGIRLVVSIHTHQESSSGAYHRELAVMFSNGKTIRLPFEISVLDAAVPVESTINTNLFSLDLPSLGYWYGAGPDSNRLGELVNNAADVLAEHRFSPSKTPLWVGGAGRSAQVSEAVGKDGKLELNVDEIRTTRGPLFTDLTLGFSVNFGLQVGKDAEGKVVSHKWHGREAGYSIDIIGDTVTLTGRIIEPKQTPEEVLRKYLPVEVSSEWPEDGNLHTLEITITPTRWATSIDGMETASTDVTGEVEPAPGGWLSFGPLSVDAVVTNPTWSFVLPENASDNVQKEEFAAFDTEILFVQSNIGEASSASFDEWLSRTLGNGQFVNDLRESFERQPSKTIERIKAYDKAVLDRAFVSLPVDEGTSGRLLDLNLTFAKAVKQNVPDVRRFHTFGSMRGHHRTRAARLAGLESYEGYVDIWSARMSLLAEQSDFFEEQEKAGSDLSPYIHDVNIVEDPNVLLMGRVFFNRLGESGTSHVSFWNTMLWFQPSKSVRPMRYIETTPSGFTVSKRNPAGIAAGMLFYPGQQGLLTSLRAIGWQDGIEDLELFAYLEQLDHNQLSSHHLAQLDNLFSRRTALFSENRHPKKILRSDSVGIRELRSLVENLLDELSSESE